MTDSNFHRFAHGHQDLVLATSYNFYGTRLATASADHKVKVWDLDEETQRWQITDTWIAHNAEVSDVKWNGPYVGEHLGTVGEDGLLKIWQEDAHEPLNSGRRFKVIFKQTSATGVPCMALNFKNLGLETYLAYVTRDGFITVAEPEDPDKLSSWRVLWSEYLCKTPARTEETAFRLCWHREKVPAWPAVLAGLDVKSLSLAVAVGSSVRVFRTDKDRKFYLAATIEGAKDLVRDVDWANGSMRGYDAIATASRDGRVRIYELYTPGGTALPASSSALVAAAKAADDTPASSLSVRPARSGIGAGLAGARGRRDENARSPGAVKQEVKMVAEFETHNGAPWRVRWTPTADALLSAGDDGVTRIWKKTTEGKWAEAAVIDAVNSNPS